MEKMWGTSVFSKRICGESERVEALEERRSEDSGTKVRLSFFNADDDKSNQAILFNRLCATDFNI